MFLKFGILQRYVMGEVFRAFLLALIAITSVIVLFMIMAEAARAGLSPPEILQIAPFVAPSSLPFTIPISLLFAVCLVYGRMASDNEITAIKSAGVSAFAVVWPALGLSIAISGLMYYMSSDFVPQCGNQVKKILYRNIEDVMYKILKQNGQFENPRWPFIIRVKDVEGRTLISPIFIRKAKHPTPERPYTLHIQAAKATISFDLQNWLVRVHLINAQMQQMTESPNEMIIRDNVLEMPLGKDVWKSPDKKVQEMTLSEILEKQRQFRDQVQNERKRQAISMAFWFASGRVKEFEWRGVHEAYAKFSYWERQLVELETEKQFRIALAAGPFFFVLLGAPVGILFARRDFLSAFMTCFLPIILIYYPLTLCGVNISKEGLVDPTVALWAGNAVLAIIAGFVLQSVRKH